MSFKKQFLYLNNELSFIPTTYKFILSVQLSGTFDYSHFPDPGSNHASHEIIKDEINKNEN